MKPRVYVETTIVSYLTAKASGDLITAAHQQITQEWWDNRRPQFDLYVSQLVVTEARAGDPEAAERRLASLSAISLLEPREDALRLAEDLIRAGAIPEKAAADAAHIAIAAAHGMNYLLTWNCAHIANAEMRVAIEGACRARGLEPPVLCTPEELMGDEYAAR